MKIKDLLSDDDLYELWLLMTDAIWETLINHYSESDVYEGYVFKRQPTRRRLIRTGPARRNFRRPPKVPVKPLVSPKSSLPSPRIKSVSQSQLSGTNPKIDMLKGSNAQLDNHNVFPNISDNEIKAEIKSRGRK
jgi:hypothetical protein